MDSLERGGGVSRSNNSTFLLTYIPYVSFLSLYVNYGLSAHMLVIQKNHSKK